MMDMARWAMVCAQIDQRREKDATPRGSDAAAIRCNTAKGRAIGRVDLRMSDVAV